MSKMVKELILDEDRVVLPGLGCFVAEVVPATFSDRGYTINPPYRRLYFRARPDEGDVLADFYARSNDVDKDVADRIIKDFVAELKTLLLTRKTVVFPGLGRLRATKENNIFFVANEDLDIYPAGFGLEPVSLKTHQETPQEVKVAVAELKALVKEPEPVPEPVPEQIPDPEPVPEPVPEPETIPESVSEPESVLAPIPVSEPEPVPEPVPETAPVPESTPISDPEPEQVAVPDRKSGRTFLKVCIVILAVILVLFIAYAAVGRLCPEWIDRFLYSAEELEILNR